MVFLPLLVKTRHGVVSLISQSSWSSIASSAIELVFLFSLATVFILAEGFVLIATLMILAVELVLVPSTTMLTLTLSWSGCHQRT